MQLSNGAYYLTTYANGKVTWTRLGKDFGTALQEYGKVIAPVRTGETFNDPADRFEIDEEDGLPSLVDGEPRYSENTKRSYRCWLKPLREVFGPVQLIDIKPMHAQRYLKESAHKVSANRQISLLSTLLSTAVRWGWLERNPLLDHLKMNEEHERKMLITDEQYQRLIACADFQMACLIKVAYLTALRKSDIIAIQWKDLHDGALHVVQQKTGVPIAFSLEGELGGVFEALKKKRKVLGHHVFLNKHHRPICGRTVDTYWWEVRDKAGLPDIVFHDLRRKRITDLNNKHGIDLAQKVAGHLDSKTTERYVVDDGQIEVISLPA